jgi:ATPase family associated with various cellular activities (AAA)
MDARGSAHAPVTEHMDSSADESVTCDILPALYALDEMLERAVAATQAAWANDAASERFRGLYIGGAEIERLLQQTTAESTAPAAASLPDRAAACSPLRKLRELYPLTTFDLAVVIIALAPELDLRYERLYGYLQDDVTRKRPTVDLVLKLLCASPQEKLQRRSHFVPEAPLLRHAILRLFSDADPQQAPLLAHSLKLDPQILHWLIGQKGLDTRLSGCCHLTHGRNPLPRFAVPSGVKHALPRFFAADYSQCALLLQFRGANKSWMCFAAEAAAAEHHFSLLISDLSACTDSSLEENISLVLREASFQSAIAYFEPADARLHTLLSRTLARNAGLAITASENGETCSWIEGCNVITVDFDHLDLKQRRACWQQGLTQQGLETDGATLDALAARYPLGFEQIRQAIAEGYAKARWRQAASESDGWGVAPRPQPDELYAAARAQSGPQLAAVARKLEPIYSWDDLVVPSSIRNQLHEICQRVTHKEHVLHTWGFDKKLSLGKGATALFAGPSGTGKTMAAEVIANEVKLDLYKIDLAGVVSKYIGETEKNLDRIFSAAEGTNAILFFDEADALFGKRSEVRDSHDRYANIEISYLLQKMDTYQGTAILASNLRQHMDESFIRRLAFTVLFPFPDETHRLRIWKGIWPLETPLAEDLDFDYLADRFKLSGGNIKNIALAAAFLAAQDRGVVHMSHLLRGVEREYQKMGKSISIEDLTTEAARVVVS